MGAGGMAGGNVPAVARYRYLRFTRASTRRPSVGAFYDVASCYERPTTTTLFENTFQSGHTACFGTSGLIREGATVLRKALATALLAAGLVASAHAAVLLVSGGELTGALGVNVGGTLYDVQFVEGTCETLFSGCDEASDFAFSPFSVELAAQALMDQVLLDTAQGSFDSASDLTFGCESNNGCLIYTPYAAPLAGLVVVEYALNSNFEFADGVGSFGNGSSLDTTFEGFAVYARWLPAATVPEPGSLALFGLGLFGLAWRLRKNS
jgi:hypothetical protein